MSDFVFNDAPKPDTSAEAVERLALLATSRAVLGHAAALSGDEDEDRRDKLNRVAREHAETAATLRALLAERDAALADGWAAGREALPMPSPAETVRELRDHQEITDARTGQILRKPQPPPMRKVIRGGWTYRDDGPVTTDPVRDRDEM